MLLWGVCNYLEFGFQMVSLGEILFETQVVKIQGLKLHSFRFYPVTRKQSQLQKSV